MEPDESTKSAFLGSPSQALKKLGQRGNTRASAPIARKTLLLTALVSMVCLFCSCEMEDVIDPSEELGVAGAPKKYTTTAEDQSIICRVYDSVTMQFLRNSTVTVISPEGSITTFQSPSGEFEIENVVLGIYKIKVRKGGFTELSKNVEVVPKECGDCISYYMADFYLTPISEPQAIGPTGGEISIAKLARIEIPAGALRDQSDISATFIQPVGVPELPDLEPELEPDLHILGGLDLRPIGLEFDLPITITLFIDSELLTEGAIVWLYSFDPISEKWVEPVEVQLNEDRTQAVVQITYFSLFGWFTDKRYIRTEVALIRDGTRFYPFDDRWIVLESLECCGKSAVASEAQFPIIYEGNPGYEPPARRAVEDKVARREIEIHYFSLICEGIPESVTSIEYRILYRVYDVIVYSLSGPSAVVGQIMVPERVDFICGYGPCHDQGGFIMQ